MPEQASITVTKMKAFLDCFNRKDLDGIMGYFADDGVFVTPRGKEPAGRTVEGKAAIRAYFAKMFANVPDINFGEDSHWVAGDFGVSEWTLTGTGPDGSALNFRGTDHFLFRAGKIVRKDTFQKIVD